MQMRKTESEFGAPAGVYVAEFQGVFPMTEATPRLGRDGKPMPPGIEWRFKIVEGPFAGRIISRITSKTPTAKNACGVLLDGVAGRPLGLEEVFDPDTMRGRQYQVAVDRSKTNPDRTQVTSVFRSGTPTTPPAPASTENGAPPPPPSDVNYYVQTTPGMPPEMMTETELQAWLVREKRDPAALQICRVGQREWLTAAACGFKNEVVF
jgi:hypothetical protein